MSSCEELRILLGGYVLEALEPDEAAEVRAHMSECPACAAEHASLAGLPALLELARGIDQPIEPLPQGFEEKLLDSFSRERGESPPRRRRRLPKLTWTLPRVAVASAVVAAALGAGTVAVLKDGAPAAGPSGWDGSYMLPLRAAATAPGASARVALARTKGGTKVHLWAKGLPPDSSQVYEMLCEGKGMSASAGTFRADAEGRINVQLTTAARVGEYEHVRIVRQTNGHTGENVLEARLF